jgi:hypothetical protein
MLKVLLRPQPWLHTLQPAAPWLKVMVGQWHTLRLQLASSS